MVEPVAVAAVALLVLGVAGSVLPVLPGAALSLAGVYLYAALGARPLGLPLLAALTLAAAAAVAVDLAGGAVAARAGGAGAWTTLAAVLVGVVLLVFAGPVGLVAGVTGTVLVLELVRGATVAAGARSAAFAAVGVLASAVVQVLVTLAMLGAVLVAVFGPF